MKLLHTLPILLICLLCAACGGIDAEATLKHAENAMADGDLQLAEAGCQTLCDTTAVTLTADQTCRLAMIYCKLYDSTQDTDYAGTAAMLFARAGAADSTCVGTFFDSLPVEDQSLMQAISELNSVAHTHDTDIHDEEEPDSIPANPEQP